MSSKVKKKGHSNGGPPKGHAPYPGCETGGRPRKWDGESLDELAERLDEWIANAIETKKEFFWWDWCFEVGLNQHRVAKLTERSDKFRRSYENAKAWQETIVCRYALTKKFSEGFSKFFLINRNPDQWKEKSTPEPASQGTSSEKQTHDALLAQIKTLQESLERSMAEKSNNTDNKS